MLNYLKKVPLTVYLAVVIIVSMLVALAILIPGIAIPFICLAVLLWSVDRLYTWLREEK